MIAVCLRGRLLGLDGVSAAFPLSYLRGRLLDLDDVAAAFPLGYLRRIPSLDSFLLLALFLYYLLCLSSGCFNFRRASSVPSGRLLVQPVSFCLVAR